MKLRLLMVIFLVVTFSYKLIYAASITFEWDSNTEPDIAGYRIYQSSEIGGHTFGAGNEVKDVAHVSGVATQITTLEDVAPGTWYWVATAYNTSGRESYRSNEVSETISEGPDVPPVVPKRFIMVGVDTAKYTIQGLPLNLMDTFPESKDVVLILHSIPSGAVEIKLLFTVYDADFGDEGRIFINGQNPIALFGDEGIVANNNITKSLDPINTNLSLYQLGNNILTFWHDNTAGYIIEDIIIKFGY